MGQKISQFTALPVAAHRAADRGAPDTGIVEEVLDSKIDGDAYSAYLIRWHGSHVALAVEGAAATLYQAGDSIPILVSRTRLPTGGGGLLSFAAGPAADQGATKEDPLNGPTNVNSATVTATVERVLSAQADDYSYRAYVVPWHGAHVIVADIFASTHFNAGDRISFAAARVTSSGTRYVAFMLFAFPCSASTPCKSSPTPATATH